MEVFFSIKKCGINNCSSGLAPQLPPAVFSTLHHLADPEPSKVNEGHYKIFDEIYHTKTSEEILPSNTITERSHGIPLKQHTKKIQKVSLL